MTQKGIKDKIRYWYYLPKRSRLKNKTPSILANNCIGTVLSHDMRLRFRSPTVNLFMRPHEFLNFLESLDYYTNCEVEETFEEGIQYPLGVMHRGEEQVKLYFVHYRSFEEARQKWMQRRQRIDRANLFVVFEYVNLEEDSETWRRFCALPFDNKVILTGDTAFEHPDLVHIDLYNEPYQEGKIFAIKPDTVLHRWLDDFDYVSFLNKGKTD